MAIKLDNTNVTSISLDDEEVKKIILDSSSVWCKPYTFTLTKQSNVASISLSRSSTSEPTASTGTLLSNTGTATIYYEDKITASATAATGYHFGTDQSKTTDSYTNNLVSANVSWGPTVSINTYTITWKYLSAYPDTWTTVTESYNYGATPSRTAPSTVTSGNNRKVFANWDDLSVVTSNRTITAVYTQQYYATISPSYCTANRTTGWYNSGTVITWTANDNYSFGGSAVQDTATTTISSGTTYSKSPSYVKCTISATRCSANKTSGSILAVGTTITWTANSNCAFDSTGTTTSTTNVALSDTFYYGSASYLYVTVSGTNCTANKSTGWFAYGTQCTWTASTNYAFGSSGTTTTTDTFLIPGRNYTKTPGYGKYTVTCTNCTANVSTGWYEVTTSKSTTFTANTNWSFGGSTLKDTTSNSAAVPGSVSASPGYCNITVSSTNCTANVASGIVANGTTITWTRSTGYAFDSSGTTTVTATVSGPGTYSKSPGYGYLTVGGSHRSVTANDAGWYTAGSSVTTTFKADSGWSFGGSTAQDTTTKTTTVPGTNSATPSYFYATIQATNSSANKSTGWYNASFTCTWTASTNYAFDNAGTTTSAQTISSPGTYSKSPGYGKYTLSLTNCAYNSGNNAGWYALGTKPSTTVKANAGWSFGGTTAQDTTTIGGTNAVPTTVSGSPSYFYITVNAGTGCSADTASGFYRSSTKPSSITWTPNEYYSFEAGEHQQLYRNSNISSAPATYTATPTNYRAASIGTSSYCTADKDSEMYYAAGTNITWTAGSNYSFGGSAVSDTTTTGPITAGGTFNAPDPGYVKCTIEATNCEASETSGSILAVGTIITFTAATDIAFDENGTTIISGTVKLSSYSYSASAQYAHVNIQAGTGCTVNKPIGWGWYRFGVTLIKWTPNTNYSFYSSGSSSAVSQGVWEAGVTYSRTPEYGYLKINAYTCSGTSSGWYTVGNKVISMTASSGWAFNKNGGTTITETKTVPGTYSYSAPYKVLNDLTIEEYGDNSVGFINPSSNPAVIITAYWDGNPSNPVQYLNGRTIAPGEESYFSPDRTAYVHFYIEAYGTCELYTRTQTRTLRVDPAD